MSGWRIISLSLLALSALVSTALFVGHSFADAQGLPPASPLVQAVCAKMPGSVIEITTPVSGDAGSRVSLRQVIHCEIREILESQPQSWEQKS